MIARAYRAGVGKAAASRAGSGRTYLKPSGASKAPAVSGVRFFPAEVGLSVGRASPRLFGYALRRQPFRQFRSR
jgi:hypothetical protein